MRGKMHVIAAALGGFLLMASPAAAGEVKFGTQALDTDGSGKLTPAARDSAVTTIEAEPGNEVWIVHMWAQIDNPAEGPLYIEFYRKRDGKPLVAHRRDYDDYAGDKYLSIDLELEREQGFKPGETLEVAFVQNVGGKDVKKASANLTLAESTRPPPRAAEPPSESPDDDDDDDGDDRDPAATPSAGGPPPVQSGDKKGCHIGDPPAPTWLGLITIAALFRRRLRPKPSCG